MSAERASALRMLLQVELGPQEGGPVVQSSSRGQHKGSIPGKARLGGPRGPSREALSWDPMLLPRQTQRQGLQQEPHSATPGRGISGPVLEVAYQAVRLLQGAPRSRAGRLCGEGLGVWPSAVADLRSVSHEGRSHSDLRIGKALSDKGRCMEEDPCSWPWQGVTWRVVS